MVVKGINFKENAQGVIEIGIHEDFIGFLQSIPPTKTGYRNFNLSKNFKPSVKGGYTHKLEPALTPRQKYELVVPKEEQS